KAAEFSDGGTAETLVTFQAPADAFELEVNGYVVPAGPIELRRIVADFEIKTKVPRYIAFAFANPESTEIISVSQVIPGTGVTNANMVLSLVDVDDLPLTSEPTTFLPSDSGAGYWEITEKMVTYQKAFIFAVGSYDHGYVKNTLFPGRYEIKIKAAVYNP
ncbi:TPA: hypothetical protein ROF70_004432, partial [Enterobacter asburiae]|nr:hypothetical protein [Enterobacter asburiae]